jgi:hypothetical protein
MLLSSLGTSIANVGLPTLTQAFTASFQEVLSFPKIRSRRIRVKLTSKAHCLGGPPAVFRIWASRQFQTTIYASIQFALEYNSLQESVIWGIPIKDSLSIPGLPVRVGGK